MINISELYMALDLKTGQCPACANCDAVLHILSSCNICNEEVILWSEEMKEQVSVDEKQCPYCKKIFARKYNLKLHINRKQCAVLQFNCRHSGEIMDTFTGRMCSECGKNLDWGTKNKYITREEYERFKRLDENVTQLIAHKKSLLESARTYHSDNLGRHEELFLQIEELEGLYDDR